MLVLRKLLLIAPVALAAALAGCQTAGPAAKSAAVQSNSRAPVQAAKTDVVMGVGF